MGLPIGFVTSQKAAAGGGSLTPATIAAALGYKPAPLSFWNEEDINPEFVIEASCIAAASGVYSFGNPITWTILDTSSGHGYSFFNGLNLNTTNHTLEVLYPQVRKVLYGNVNIDEVGAISGVYAGAGVNFDKLEITAGSRRLLGTRLVPDGAGNWANANGNLGGYVFPTAFGAPGPGETGVSFGGIYNSDPDNIAVVYAGSNNFIVNRRYVAITSPLVFSLKDPATGLTLLANPAVTDSVSLSAFAITDDLIRLDIWYTNNFFMSGSGFNFFITGKFECWMFATNKSSTANIIKYQTNVPGATVYKLYRDTSPGFGTQVLIHTGVTGVYTDTGLTASTQYYYKLVATVAGIDTDVTTWAIRTTA